MQACHLTNWVSAGCQAAHSGRVWPTSAMYIARAARATSGRLPRSPCTTLAAQPYAQMRQGDEAS